jgi:hypothetical protein
MRPINKWKLAAGIASAAGAAVLAMGSLTAGAFAAPNLENPYGAQSANVPYVAWVGEHVRLVACDAQFTEEIDTLAKQKNVEPKSLLSYFGNVNFAVEDWSGYQFQPPTPDGDAGSEIGQAFDPGPASFFESSEGRDCVATDYKSLNPGLTRIRAVVKNDETGEVIFSHQFLVIWLTADKPTLSEAGETATGTETFQPQLNGSGKSNLSSFLGDKLGDGKFIPSPFSDPSGPTDKGLIQIKVKGEFPVIAGTPLSNILTNTSYTLPDDWTTLAETLASSQENTEPPGGEENAKLWDIHGTPSNGSTSNTSSTSALFDTFSRDGAGGYTSGETATVGPYDPQAAYETLVSDGTLNADDAPMPALRIDVSIAGNTGGSDLGGVGQISGASKAQIYSHDFTGNPEEEGNLYNPYYGAYIPATDRGTPQSSGVTGSSPGGDFPGFLNNHPEPYTFWNPVYNSANEKTERYSGSTGCLQRINDGDPSYYQTPGGQRTETFYTDERGEAYVTYSPGDGFYLENLPVYGGAKGESEEGKLIKNENGGCDLKGLFGKTIGESGISARAVYPYEPVDYPAVTSEPLVKTVTSLWEKEWFEFSKGLGKEEANVKIVVAKAQDIDGSPITGEKVCFTAEASTSLNPYSGISGKIKDPEGLLGKGKEAEVDVSGSNVDGGQEGTGYLCVNTNSEGFATIEVINSTSGKVDLTAEYTEEKVYRDHDVLFPTNAGGLKEAGEAKEKAEAIAKAEEAAKVKAREEEEAAKAKVRAEAEATEKAKLAEEVTKKEKTAEEAKTKEEATKKANEEAAAAEKKANEEASAAEKAKNEEEIAKLVVPHATAATSGGSSGGSGASGGSASLVTPIQGTIPPAIGGVQGSKGHKAHAAKHGKKKHKKGKKSGKKK